MDEIEKLQRIVNYTRTSYSYRTKDVAHDREHINRVYHNAKKIAKKEQRKINNKVLFSAVLLHDIVNYKKSTYKSKKSSAKQSARQASKILPQVGGYNQEEIDRICRIIEEHSFSGGKDPSSPESAILQDADRLDAIGAIGIARAFAVGGSEKRMLYDPDDPFCNTRNPDDKKSTVDHFFVKLNLLEQNMNTKTAKREAKRRTRFMVRFLESLSKDISKNSI